MNAARFLQSRFPEPTWPRWFWPLFGLALLANLLPLVVSPILPFCDLHGAAGLLGAWVHREEAAARINAYFTFNVRPGPNVIFYGVGWLFTRIFSVYAATNLFIALFCVIALPVSFLVALRATGRDPVLSFLAFPLIYHRCLWYGFVGSVAGVPLMLMTFAFATLAFSSPRRSWRDLALTLTLLVLSTAHVFIFLATWSIVVLWALLAFRQPSTLARRLVVSVPALAYIGPWLGKSIFGHRDNAAPGAGSGLSMLVGQLWKQRPPLASYVRNAHDWLIDGYAGPVDDVVATIFVLTLLLFLLFGVRPMKTPSSAAGSAPPTDKIWSLRLPITVVLLGAGYLFLPMSITFPLGWWAVHVRLLVPFLLVLALLIPTRRRGLPRLAAVPVLAAAAFYGGFMAHDLRTWWVGVELKSFSTALAAIPPGQRVHALYPPFGNERHYSHFPMGYTVDYYMVDRGGTAAPAMWGLPGEAWIDWRPQGPRPAWGLASAFNWAAHAPYWDYFLLKQPAPGNGGAIDTTALFSGAPPGAVRKIFEQDLWSVWKRER